MQLGAPVLERLRGGRGFGADAREQAIAGLAAVLGRLRDLGLQADCVTWINGVELLDVASVCELLALGPLTGTAVIVSSASSTYAAQLASGAAVVAAGHPVGIDLRRALALRLGSGRPGAVMGREVATDAQLGAADPTWSPLEHARGVVRMIVFSPGLDGSPRAVTNCRVQPITLDHVW